MELGATKLSGDRLLAQCPAVCKPYVLSLVINFVADYQILQAEMVETLNQIVGDRSLEIAPTCFTIPDDDTPPFPSFQDRPNQSPESMNQGLFRSPLFMKKAAYAFVQYLPFMHHSISGRKNTSHFTLPALLNS